MGKREGERCRGGEQTADRSAKKREKVGGYRVQGGGKEEDEWRQGGEQTADGFAEKRAKMRGIVTQGRQRAMN